MSNNNKNIYYTSNAFQSKYPGNSRSSFVNQIDEEEFHYLKKQNIELIINNSMLVEFLMDGQQMK